MAIRDYRDLLAWQRSVDLIEEVYRVTRSFPREERFGITHQLRKAAVSASINIAEGSGRATTPDLLNFLSQSRGSVKESEALILISRRLRFIGEDESAVVLSLTEEVAKIVAGLRSSLRSNSRRHR